MKRFDCAFCGKRADDYVCSTCRAKLPWHTKVVFTVGGGEVNGATQRTIRVAAPLMYRGVARQALVRFKFNGEWWRADTFGKLMAICARNTLLNGQWIVDNGQLANEQHSAEQENISQSLSTVNYQLSTVITFVPLNPWRRIKRHYEQTRLLAKAIADELDLPLVRALSKRKIWQRPNSSLPHNERTENVRGAFQLYKPPLHQLWQYIRTHAADRVISDYVPQDIDLHGKRVLLVDDVCTTGATLQECVHILYTAGASDVVCVALCKA